MDAVARALLGRVDDLEPQVSGDVGAGARCQHHLAGGILDVGQAVDVELEDLRRVLHTEPISGA